MTIYNYHIKLKWLFLSQNQANDFFQSQNQDNMTILITNQDKMTIFNHKIKIKGLFVVTKIRKWSLKGAGVVIINSKVLV